MGDREKRVGINEAVFRELNERIEDLAEKFQVRSDEGLDLVCECAEIECAQRIRMTPAAYQTVRAEPTHFAVYPGHWTTQVERVITRQKGYAVVEKLGDAAEMAEATDPRT